MSLFKSATKRENGGTKARFSSNSRMSLTWPVQLLPIQGFSIHFRMRASLPSIPSVRRRHLFQSCFCVLPAQSREAVLCQGPLNTKRWDGCSLNKRHKPGGGRCTSFPSGLCPSNCGICCQQASSEAERRSNIEETSFLLTVTYLKGKLGLSLSSPLPAGFLLS